MINNQQIAKNTILLYFRMIFLMLISLLTSRVILQILGVEDYGIYNIVGGFVSFLGFINGAISSGTSRYITFAIGQKDIDKLNRVISTCKLVHFIIAFIILILGETLGLWFVMNKLIIPESRMMAALWVYHCSIVSVVVMVWSIPYNACIIAHEKMSAFAYISIYEAVMKLIIVLVLMTNYIDKLILYSVLLLCIQISIRLIYTKYCHRHFEESKVDMLYDKKLFLEIISFSGWNLWGNLAAALYTQGVNIVLNIFFGPIVNAARGISVTVQSAVQQFATNFQTAINPQITKSYASGNNDAMYTLVCRSSKFTFILLYAISLPILVETRFVINLWLGQVPNYTVNFIRLMLCICLVDAMANPFMTAAAATGKIKFYQLAISGILLLILPISYIVLWMGYAPESVFIVHLLITFLAYIVRLFIVRSMINISLVFYFRSVLMPSCIVCILSFGVMLIFDFMFSFGILSPFINILSSVLIVLILSYFLVLTPAEKTYFIKKIPILLAKLKK